MVSDVVRDCALRWFGKRKFSEIPKVCYHRWNRFLNSRKTNIKQIINICAHWTLRSQVCEIFQKERILTFSRKKVGISYRIGERREKRPHEIFWFWVRVFKFEKKKKIWINDLTWKKKKFTPSFPHIFQYY